MEFMVNSNIIVNSTTIAHLLILLGIWYTQELCNAIHYNYLEVDV